MDNLQEQFLCCAVLALAAATAAATNTVNATTFSTTTTVPTTSTTPTTTATAGAIAATTTVAAVTTTAAATTTNMATAGSPARYDILARGLTSATTARPSSSTAADSDTAETSKKKTWSALQAGRWGRSSSEAVTNSLASSGGQAEDNDDSEPYSFDYSVRDPTTGDTKSQWESRVDGIVRGQYSLLQPDGSLRSVSYTADNQNGFRALVRVDSPGLPQGPVGSNVPTSSVSSSAAASSGGRPAAPASATHAVNNGALLYPAFPRPSAEVPPSGAGTSPIGTSGGGAFSSGTSGSTRTPPGQASSSASGETPSPPPSASSSSTAEPASLDGAVAQALRDGPLQLDDGGEHGDEWKAILGPSAERPMEGNGQGYGLDDADELAHLYSQQHVLPQHDGSGGAGGAGEQQPPWLRPDGEHNSIEHEPVGSMIGAPEDSLGAVHPPVRLPLEHEVTANNHYVFADPGEDGPGGAATHVGPPRGEELGPFGPLGPLGQGMELLMRRQRARKRQVPVNNNHVVVMRVRPVHHQQHQQPPPRWMWAMQ